MQPEHPTPQPSQLPCKGRKPVKWTTHQFQSLLSP